MKMPKAKLVIILAATLGIVACLTYIFVRPPKAERDAIALGEKFSREIDHNEVFDWAAEVQSRKFPGERYETEIDSSEWPSSIQSIFDDDFVTCHVYLAESGECLGLYFRRGISIIVFPVGENILREDYFSVHKIAGEDRF